MTGLTELLDEARREDPDDPTETTDAERIEHEIYERLNDLLHTSHDVPAIALMAILWERFKSKTAPDEMDILLGAWLFRIDQSSKTLNLLKKWFEGTSLGDAVDDLLN